MRVVVDKDICSGHALCEELAPDLFEMHSDGIAYTLVDEVTEENRAKFEEVVLRCPSEAIRFEK